MSDPFRRCSLPHLGALSLNAFQKLAEDFDPQHAQILMQNLRSAYPGAKFYHSAYCKAMSSYTFAFGTRTVDGKKQDDANRLAQGLGPRENTGGPSAPAFEFLYEFFQAEGMLDGIPAAGMPTQLNIYLLPNEAKFDFFMRACAAANDIREDVRNALRRERDGIFFREDLNNYEHHWVWNDLGFAAEVVTNLNNEYPRLVNGHGTLLPLVHSNLLSNVAFYDKVFHDNPYIAYDVAREPTLPDALMIEVWARFFAKTPSAIDIVVENETFGFHFQLQDTGGLSRPYNNLRAGISSALTHNPHVYKFAFQYHYFTPTIDDHLKVIKWEPQHIRDVGNRLLSDADFVARAIKVNPEVFNYLNPNHFSDADYAARAIKVNPEVFNYLNPNNYERPDLAFELSRPPSNDYPKYEEWNYIVYSYLVAYPRGIQEPQFIEFRKSLEFLDDVSASNFRIFEFLDKEEYSAADWATLEAMYERRRGLHETRRQDSAFLASLF